MTVVRAPIPGMLLAATVLVTCGFPEAVPYSMDRLVKAGQTDKVRAYSTFHHVRLRVTDKVASEGYFTGTQTWLWHNYVALPGTAPFVVDSTPMTSSWKYPYLILQSGGVCFFQPDEFEIAAGIPIGEPISLEGTLFDFKTLKSGDVVPLFEYCALPAAD